MIFYLIYILIDNSAERGGYRSIWVQRWKFWDYYASYYPSKLIRETALDPNNSYVFGYHPHGLIGLGCLTHFASNAMGFDELFPGIKMHVSTLKVNFFLPFYREFFLLMGLIACSKPSLNYVLSKGGGNACLVVIGGAKEALLSNPGKADLVLKDRLGFVKLAIQNGSHLVPVYCFGENHQYYIKGDFSFTPMKLLQQTLKTYFGFYTPYIQGRFPFTEKFGFMPRRVPMAVVVGKPIPVEKDSNPNYEKIMRYHELYMNQLQQLYDKYKSIYVPEPDLPIPELNFI